MRLFNIKSIQFNQIFSDINAFLARSTGSVKSINKNTVFGQLMTVFSGFIHNVMSYIEDAFTEQNKYTAQRKKSIMGLAALTGYEPSLGKASGAWIRIAHKPANRIPLDIILKNRQRLICTKNGLYYNLIIEKSPSIVIKSDSVNTNEYFYIAQGRFETQTFAVPGGIPFYVQNFKFIGFIDTEYIDITINGISWTKKCSLYDMNPNEPAYCIKHNPLEGLDIIFGNGINGRILSEGDVLGITYLLHDGETGNIDSNENIQFLFNDTLYDVGGNEVDGNMVFDVRLATKDAITAGADPEDVNQIQQMIGFNTRSLVLSDSNAYKEFLGKYSFVGFNRTWSEQGSLVVRSLILKNYKQSLRSGSDYFSLNQNSFSLSDIQKKSIQNAMVSSGRVLAGTIYSIIDVKLSRYALYVYIKLSDNSIDKEIVKNNIREVVGAYFGELKSDSYIPKSDIIKYIQASVPGIEGINCYFLSQENEEALRRRSYEDIKYEFDHSTGTYKTKVFTVKLLPNENPGLGLDAHGNIYIESDYKYPVLLGGWEFMNDKNQVVTVSDPLIITFEA